MTPLLHRGPVIQANFKKNLQQPGTHVSIADHPSFTWQFAPPVARDTEIDLDSFVTIVRDKFRAVQLANTGGAPNTGGTRSARLKRGRDGEGDQGGRTPAKKARVGAGRPQAVSRSGERGKPDVPIPPDTGLVESGTGRSREMKELLGMDIFRERVFEWFAGASSVPAGALCLALAEVGLNVRDPTIHMSKWTRYVLRGGSAAHAEIMEWDMDPERQTLLSRQLSNAVSVALTLDPRGRQNLDGAAELIVEGYMGTPIVRTPMLHAAQYHSQDGHLNG